MKSAILEVCTLAVRVASCARARPAATGCRAIDHAGFRPWSLELESMLSGSIQRVVTSVAEQTDAPGLESQRPC
jgi:hypothetical protein